MLTPAEMLHEINPQTAIFSTTDGRDAYEVSQWLITRVNENDVMGPSHIQTEQLGRALIQDLRKIFAEEPHALSIIEAWIVGADEKLMSGAKEICKQTRGIVFTPDTKWEEVPLYES